MQAADSHIVIGSSNCITFGGHFMVLVTIRRSVFTVLHLTIMDRVLTNASHSSIREIFVRILAFWLNLITSTRCCYIPLF